MIRSISSWVKLGLIVCAFSACTSVLGIEERQLDVEDLTEEGYKGCEPGNRVCDGCTSEWHLCICQGWTDKAEAELKLDCASLSPTAVRDDIVKQAEDEYEVWRREETKRQELADNQKSEADGGKSSDPVEPEPGVKPVVEPDGGVFGAGFCNFQTPPDDCQGCFCDQCSTPINDCIDDDGCTQILNCVFTSGCDPEVEQGPGSCVEDPQCGGLINDNGGLQGSSYGLYRDTIKCAVDSNCPCGAGPAGPQCNTDVGCDTCPDCWGRCFCEGGNADDCRKQCGNPDCTQDMGCSVCADCMDACLCVGDKDPAGCELECRGPPGGANCTPEMNCDCNGDCFAECRCGGDSIDVCSSQCGGATSTLGCFDYDNCFGCATCLGDCACQSNGPLVDCAISCGADACQADSCDSCQSCQMRCECEGEDPFYCYEQCSGGTCATDGSCDSCACGQCPSEFGLCEENAGCLELMNCMEQTGCFSIAECAKPEFCQSAINDLGGLDAPVMGVVEALQECRITHGCPCSQGQPPVDDITQPIQCGDTTCEAFAPPPPDPIARACCVSDASGTLSGCGLDAAPLFGQGVGEPCQPIDQPGAVDAQCPSYYPSPLPWDGAELLGCCTDKGECGFMDDFTGLGCISSQLFGEPSYPCGG